jgi:hypothetical protein
MRRTVGERYGKFISRWEATDPNSAAGSTAHPSTAKPGVVQALCGAQNAGPMQQSPDFFTRNDAVQSRAGFQPAPDG